MLISDPGEISLAYPFRQLGTVVSHAVRFDIPIWATLTQSHLDEVYWSRVFVTLPLWWALVKSSASFDHSHCMAYNV